MLNGAFFHICGFIFSTQILFRDTIQVNVMIWKIDCVSIIQAKPHRSKMECRGELYGKVHAQLEVKQFYWRRRSNREELRDSLPISGSMISRGALRAKIVSSNLAAPTKARTSGLLSLRGCFTRSNPPISKQLPIHLVFCCLVLCSTNSCAIIFMDAQKKRWLYLHNY